jgi:DNA helicase-2/ATP-dependent DNA helicase PcrA
VAAVATEIPRENIGTIHSLAYRAIGAGDIAETKADSFNEFCAEHKQPTMQLSSGMVKATADDDIVEPIKASKDETPGDKNYREMNIFRAKMRPVESWPDSVKTFHKLWNVWKTESGIHDFTDLLEIAIRDVAVAPGDPGALLADESQDFSKLAFALLRKWGERALRFIHVGDTQQLLYEWAGVSIDSFYSVKLPPEQIKTLSQSYRVPRGVHELAMKWIAGTPNHVPVEYRPRDFDGKVRRLSASIYKPEKAITDAKQRIADGKSVMFATTCSYMLGGIIRELRNAGISYHNPYRVSRGDWNPLNRRGTTAVARLLAFVKVSPQFKRPGDLSVWTWGDVAKWAEWIKASNVLMYGAKAAIQRNGKERKDEKVDWLELANMFNMEHWDGLEDGKLEWWGKLLPEERRKQLAYPVKILRTGGIEALEQEPQAIVTTIHAAKGGEADVCYVWPDLSPQAHSEWMGGGTGREGIRRAFYVAFTRPREELVLCQPETSMSIRI